MWEKKILDKEEILDCLKNSLERFYDIELDDLILSVNEDKKIIYLSYFIFYQGNKQKVYLPFNIGDFVRLLKLVLEKRFGETKLLILPGEELRCRINYKLTDFNYGRRRKK